MIDFIIANPAQCLVLALCSFAMYPLFELVYMALSPAPPKTAQQDTILVKGGES